MSTPAPILLEVNHVSRTFGSLQALNNVSMYMAEGELVGLIGPNGAGKTTLFNLLTGVYEPSAGKIHLAGEKLNGLKPYQINQKGAARTFQNIRLFGQMSVVDNIKMAFHQHARHSAVSSMFRLPMHFKGEKEINKKANEILEIFNLKDREHELAGNLSYGKQRRLEIARALATGPKVLLLDEPAAGMNPQETAELMTLIKWIKDNYKLSILLIEHDMSLVMNVCDRIYVLDRGERIAEGTPEVIRTSAQVIEAYLGQDAEEEGHA